MTDVDHRGAPARQRIERDRFVAFAFCWAEALLEIDADGTVAYATGVLPALIERSPASLVGTAFADLAVETDRTLARELVAVAAGGGRIEDAALRLAGPDGAGVSVAVAGYRLDDLDGHCFFALRSAGAARAGSGGRDRHSGLYAADDFSTVAAERLKAGGAKAELTLISMPQMTALQDRLDAETRRALAGTLGAALRARSMGGDSAGEIADGRFALVHDAGLDTRALERHLADVTRAIDPQGAGIDAESATLDVDPASLEDEDLANGLVYVINQFRESKGSEFSLSSFAANLKSMVDQAADTVHDFRRIVDGGAFEIAFHPIVGVRGGRVHHYEALVRFHSGSPTDSPFKIITLAEEIGLIWQFDIAMARKVVEWLRPRRAENHKIAVNISGQSIANDSYRAALFALLEANPWAREHLLFEITESARIADLADANQFFQTLRTRGYEICLDDFGAGAASFQYLASLDVDVVKLDGSAVKNALVARKGRAFLTALTKLCRDIGVETVAEMIDDTETLDFVRDCGVDYGQGYLFGKPSTEIADFAKTGLPRLK